jgi:DNA-directed RNA polymerase subunit M/transcription elongation factor TFIIS
MQSLSKCPKCGSKEVYYNPQPVLKGGWISVQNEGWRATAMLTFLVCTQCYYLDWFVNDEGVEHIRRAWIPKNPRKSKRKNDE